MSLGDISLAIFLGLLLQLVILALFPFPTMLAVTMLLGGALVILQVVIVLRDQSEDSV